MMTYSEKAPPKLTVMIPVYNGAHSIGVAIRSLIHQTYGNWLCVVVDDGSTDGTAELLNAYQADTRFKIITLPENKGRGNARDVALKNAEGKYVAYLDADDFYHPGKLEMQVECMERNPDVSLVSCGIGAVDQHRQLRTVRGQGDGSPHYQKDVQLPPFFPASAMVRLAEARQYAYRSNLNVAEDGDYFRRLLRGRRYIMLGDIAYYYHEIGSTTSLKLLSYYWQTLRSRAYLLRDNFSYGIKALLVHCAKFVAYLLVLPFVGADFFLLKRGRKPTGNELREMQSVLTILNI